MVGAREEAPSGAASVVCLYTNTNANTNTNTKSAEAHLARVDAREESLLGAAPVV